jgi:hypothetical protein
MIRNQKGVCAQTDIVEVNESGIDSYFQTASLEELPTHQTPLLGILEFCTS